MEVGLPAESKLTGINAMINESPILERLEVHVEMYTASDNSTLSRNFHFFTKGGFGIGLNCSMKEGSFWLWEPCTKCSGPMYKWRLDSKSCSRCDQGPKDGVSLHSKVEKWEGVVPTEPLTPPLQYAGLNPVEISSLADTMTAIVSACGEILSDFPPL